MEVKKPTTYDEQIDILKKRGLIITDENKVKQFLSNVNYYTFSGYLHDYKTTNTQYENGLTFNKVYNIYQCDKRFKNILNYAIEIIEHSLKTKLSYTFAHKYGALGYLNSSNFKSKQEHDIFMSKFNQSVNQNKNVPFVKHHIKNYNSLFPIWVASELFTMGMLSNFVNNLPTSTQKEIAKEYSTGINQILSWIKCVRYLRNLTAHYMRIYNFRIQITPIKCSNNFSDSFAPSYKVFDIIYIMKFLVLDDNEWNNYILLNIENLFDKYSDYIDISAYGFPENWKELLIK